MRLPTPWVTACIGITLAGVGLDAVRAMSDDTRSAGTVTAGMSPLVGHLQPHLPPPSPDRPLPAAVLLQLADCSGNLRVLHLLHRAAVRDRVALRVLWYVGPVADSSRIRERLPSWTRRVPLVPVTPPLLAELRQMGVRSSPWLVMLDAEDRLRLSAGAPRGSREFAGLQRAIEGLTWSEGF